MFIDDLEKYSIKSSFKENIEPDEIVLDAEQAKNIEFGESPLEKKLEVPINPKIFILFGGLIFFVFAIFFIQSFNLQILKGGKYQLLADKNRTRLALYPAARGIVYDYSGLPLVRNIPSFDATIDINVLPSNPLESDRLIEKVAQIFSLSTNDLKKDVISASKSKNFSRILLASNLDHQMIVFLEAEMKKMPGVQVEKNATREYIDNLAFSHLLGYTGKLSPDEKIKYIDYSLMEKIGKNGLEAEYEKILRGSPGYRETEVDTIGREKGTLGIKQPVNGNGLILSIDAGLQKYIYDQLSRLGGKGVGIAVNPQNGQVLAMVSTPGFDNNLFAKSISTKEFQKILSDPNRPLLNRAINGEYPPGSTIKPMLAAAGLEERVVTPSTKVNDVSGEIWVGNFRFGDWKVHGVTDIIKAIAESCDVYFYTLGGGYGDIKGLGVEKIEKYLKLFGFGQPTNIDLPTERTGLVPSEEWKQAARGEKWYIGDTYHLSIGQGDLLVTPIQLVMALSAIANGGTLYQPQIVAKIIDENKNIVQVIQSRVIRSDFISEKNIEVVREGMRQTVVAGSARSLSVLPVAAAGKTGTAQFGNGQMHAWFTAFAPYENPQIAMVVLVEGGGEGSSTAVPIARETLKWYFNKIKDKK